MLVNFEDRDGTLLITPRGSRLDALVAPSFRELTSSQVDGRRIVVLDLVDVEAIDSSGLGTIIGLVKRMPPGGSLRLARPSQSVRVLLGLTRLDRVLSTFDDLESAFAA